MQSILGIDVGASGIKGAKVNLRDGSLDGSRFRVETPKPSTPKAMGDAIKEIVDYFAYSGPIGIGFPAIVKDGVALSAANIDKKWVGTNIETTFSEATGCPVFATNDADAAGMAEMAYGAGRNQNGLVMLITIGTGLGSAMFYRGVMVPNTELGHLIFPKKEAAEKYCSSGARERLKISRSEWAVRFNGYLEHLDRLFSPDLLILGGGESKYFEKYKELLKVRAKVVPAMLLNNAGIIGAAAFASHK